MTSSVPRTPIYFASLGLLLAVFSFVVSSMARVNDAVISGIQGVVFILGAVLLATAPWGFAFAWASRPWTRATRVLWFLWLTLAIPVFAVGILAVFASVWSFFEKR